MRQCIQRQAHAWYRDAPNIIAEYGMTINLHFALVEAVAFSCFANGSPLFFFHALNPFQVATFLASPIVGSNDICFHGGIPLCGAEASAVRQPIPLHGAYSVSFRYIYRKMSAPTGRSQNYIIIIIGMNTTACPITSPMSSAFNGKHPLTLHKKDGLFHGR
jgi:hypothetical protein